MGSEQPAPADPASPAYQPKSTLSLLMKPLGQPPCTDLVAGERQDLQALAAVLRVEVHEFRVLGRAARAVGGAGCSDTCIRGTSQAAARTVAPPTSPPPPPVRSPSLCKPCASARPTPSSQAALGRHVHDQQHLSLVRGERDVLAIDALHAAARSMCIEPYYHGTHLTGGLFGYDRACGM